MADCTDLNVIIDQDGLNSDLVTCMEGMECHTELRSQRSKSSIVHVQGIYAMVSLMLWFLSIRPSCRHQRHFWF